MRGHGGAWRSVGQHSGLEHRHVGLAARGGAAGGTTGSSAGVRTSRRRRHYGSFAAGSSGDAPMWGLFGRFELAGARFGI